MGSWRPVIRGIIVFKKFEGVRDGMSVLREQGEKRVKTKNV